MNVQFYLFMILLVRRFFSLPDFFLQFTKGWFISCTQNCSNYALSFSPSQRFIGNDLEKEYGTTVKHGSQATNYTLIIHYPPGLR